MADKSKPTEDRPRYVFFFTGPTACGKSTIAKYVADQLNLTFLEGDDVSLRLSYYALYLVSLSTMLTGCSQFHPQANVEKMHRGEALTDADRQGWLRALRDHEDQHPAGEDPRHPASDKSRHLVMTCSALKRQYRDILREGSAQSPSLQIRFVYLDAPEGVLVRRARERKGHFAGENLVHSQFVSLEVPGHDERDVTRVDVDRPAEEVEKEALESVRETLKGV